VLAASAHPDALSLTVTGRLCWVQVRAESGRVVFAGLLRHGQRLSYRRGGLSVVLGDAGAVRLSVYRRWWHPAGRPGQVLRFTVR
jgi:hypothetical protein